MFHNKSSYGISILYDGQKQLLERIVVGSPLSAELAHMFHTYWFGLWKLRAHDDLSIISMKTSSIKLAGEEEQKSCATITLEVSSG